MFVSFSNFHVGGCIFLFIGAVCSAILLFRDLFWDVFFGGMNRSPLKNHLVQKILPLPKWWDFFPFLAGICSPGKAVNLIPDSKSC